MTELRIPAAGDAVAEVQLVEWMATDGATVKEGDVIYAIESEKSVLDIESPASGTLKILEQPGGTFAVGHLVGQIV
ncbi:MAG TPA: lipoyl domain-containing protein [Ramlibacter sp.]|nr:lipoyl domain-containing protein [Ramlibacter sp.]